MNQTMVDETRDDDAESVAAPDVPQGRGWLPAALIVLATVLAVASAGTTWVRTQALDTDEWVAASGEVLDQPEVQAALAAYLTDQLYDAVDLAAELETVLPEDLEGLAPLVAGSLREPATEAVQRLLASPEVAAAWEAANRRAHEALVAIIRDETRENVSVADGAVVLDLGGVVRSVGENLGLPESALDRIPDGTGMITVFESDELADVQDTVRVLDFLSWFLFLLVVALFVLAVYLARDRRNALFDVGVALVVGGFVLLAGRDVAVRGVTDAIVEDPANRRTAAVVADVATELLRQMAWTGVVIGAVLAGFAVLIGPHRWAVGIRRAIGSLGHPDAVVVGIAVAFVVVLAWWSPGRIFDRWVTSLTLIAMISAAAVALSRAVHAEMSEPDTTSEERLSGPVARQ